MKCKLTDMDSYIGKGKISNRAFLFLYVTSIAVYNLLLSFQGFDMCDEGWEMTAYQQIFNNPESVEYQFLYYGSLLTGGIWNYLFGQYGYIAFRLLAVIVITLTYVVVYYLLKDTIKRLYILIGAYISMMCFDSGIIVFHHNHLTMLMVAVSCLLIFKALTKDNYLYMFLAGFVVGVNMFSRLPNLSMVVLILALIPYHLTKKNGSRTMRHLSLAVFGFFSGAGIIFLLMNILGHEVYFSNALFYGSSAANNPYSTHNWPHMLGVYVRSYAKLCIYALALLTILGGVYFVHNRTNKYIRYAAYIGVTLALLFICFRGSTLYIVYGLSSIACLYVWWRERANYPLMLLAVLAFVWLHFLPLGSDFGIGNMGASCVALSAPLSVGIARRWSSSLSGQLRIYPNYFIVVLLLIISLKSLYSIKNQCYFDKGSRLEKVYLIDHPLATTLTTKENCELLNPLLRELEKYVKADDYLLQYMKCPTIHFLTQTRPYLYNSWIWTYDPSIIKKQLDKAKVQRKNLPVLVREKSKIGDWYNYDDTWNNDSVEDSYEHKNIKISIINDFIVYNGYHVIWENEVFQILLPPSIREKLMLK